MVAYIGIRRAKSWPLFTQHASRDESATRVFRTVSWAKKVLQNTGPSRFRQSAFLDFPSTPGYTFRFLTPGGVAQLGERLNGIQEVRGSIPLASIRAAQAAARCYQPTAISLEMLIATS